MKALILLLPGLAEPERVEWGGRTPLSAASTPALDGLSRAGRVGRVQLAPEGQLPENGSALLSVLGYDPRREQPGRGALLAAGLGLESGDRDLFLRLDLLSTWHGRLVDPWAGGISPPESRLLIQALAKTLDDERLRIHAGHGSRHLLVLRGGAELDLVSRPPGRVPAGQIAAHAPSGADGELLRDLMRRAGALLAGHDVNRVRRDLGELPADAVWPWGAGRRLSLEPFELASGRSLAVVARGASPRGLGRLVGATLPPVALAGEWATPAPGRRPIGGAAGSSRPALDTLLRATRAALDEHDLVLLHVEGPGRAEPHMLAQLDRDLIAPVQRELTRRGDARLLITCDRPSPALPPSAPVPFLIWGPGVDAGRPGTFDDRAARSDLAVRRGHTLLQHLLGTGTTTRQPSDGTREQTR